MTRLSTRCAVCGIPRADHGWTAVADHNGRPGPWHHYTAPTRDAAPDAAGADLAGSHPSPVQRDTPTTERPAERRTA